MAKHQHDLYSLFLFLVLAFFILATIIKTNPELTAVTGKAVYQPKKTTTSDSLINFLKTISTRKEARTVSADPIFDYIEKKSIEPKKSFFKNFLKARIAQSQVVVIQTEKVKEPLSGKSIQRIALKTELSCSWINKDNKDYNMLKGLTGEDVCKNKEYTSCLTTNQVITSSYYSGNELKFRSTDNFFNDCNARIRTISNSFSSLETGMDIKESGYTTVLCCK